MEKKSSRVSNRSKQKKAKAGEKMDIVLIDVAGKYLANISKTVTISRAVLT